MALKITVDCIACGACGSACPNEAIRVGVDIYMIDPERCTECVGFHEVEACLSCCPVECCIPDPEHRESEQDLVRKALSLHPDDQALHSRVATNDFPSKFRG